ncbi:MAG: transposase [Candidatus Levybacteria bacterium]|nr:transposase [Candidatus Levybacteria bacterium]
MPSRIIPFVNGEYYHIFNRGVAKMQIFNNFYDYNRFVKTMIYYSIEGPKPRFSVFTPTISILNINKKIVDIICYCLMPNHFHFLLRQVKKGGITEFVSRLSNSYTKYINIKNKRVGPLLQGNFKAVHVETNEQLLHLSRYIHLNPLVSYVVKDLDIYKWSSYLEYIDLINNGICDKKIILDQFKSPKEYRQFVLDQESYGKKLEAIKHQLLDLEA